jgi:F5/8 type C domain.
MKNILYIASIVVCSAACKKMDSPFKDQIVPGGLAYPGKATSPMTFPGKNRIKIAWLRGSDASVTRATVYWNNYADSVNVDIPPTGDTISVMLEGLNEQQYAFVIKTYDAKGNVSVPVEILSAVYGNNYQQGITNRPVTQSVLSDDKLAIIYGPADLTSGAYATEVEYTNNDGELVTTRLPTNRDTLEITDRKSGTTYRTRTLYLPVEQVIDTFLTSYQEYSTFVLDKKSWTVVDFSSAHDGADNQAANVIDGTTNTRWHTHAGGPFYPHHVTVDMGSEKVMTMIGVARTFFDVPAGDDRGPDTFEFLVSDDNVTFTSVGIFNFNRLLNGEQQYHLPSSPRGRYWKFVGLTGPQPVMVLGEISVYGY